MSEPVPTTVSNPLGHASPDRYRPGLWPSALLRRMAYWLQRTMDRRHGRVLDLGCGEGALLDAAGLQGIGADLNPARLALAVQKGLQVIHADGARLPFADASFDTVVCMEVLEHVPNMETLMSEAERVLAPGGYWVISVPNVTLRSWYEMRQDRRAYYCDAEEHYREFSSVGIPWFEHRFEPMVQFESQLRKHGFEVAFRDGVRYLFPQWLSRLPALQRLLESPAADRVWSRLPWIRRFPYWAILVLRKGRA